MTEKQTFPNELDLQSEVRRIIDRRRPELRDKSIEEVREILAREIVAKGKPQKTEGK